MSRKASRNVVNDEGWTVDLRENHFGYVLDHGLTGLVLFLHRGNHGWRTPEDAQGVMMPHQAYAKNVESLIAGANSTREIVLVDVENALWQTVWAKRGNEVTWPVPGNKDGNPRRNVDVKDLRRYLRIIYRQGYARGADHEARGLFYPEREAEEYVEGEPYAVAKVLGVVS